MHTIDHRRFQQKSPRRQLPLTRIVLIAGIIVVFLIVINVIMGLVYHNKALPGYRLGAQNVGGMSYGDISRLQAKEVMITSVNLNAKVNKTAAQKTVSVNDFGVTPDMPASIEHLKKSKTWLPMLSFIVHPQIALVTHVDEGKFKSAIDALVPIFERPATDRHVAFGNGAFYVANGEAGHKINRETLRQKLTAAITDGKSKVNVPMQVLPAGKSTNDLSGEVSRLTKLISPGISFATVNSQKIVPTTSDKAQWLVADGQTMKLSDGQIGQYLDQTAQKLGIASLTNRTDLLTATKYALNKGQSYNFRMLNAATSHKHTYCTAVKGVGAAALDDLIGKLAATYSDARGWNDGGTIAFERVDNGCSYTVWLSAPQYMTTFGSICDDYYNCQVGTNVIVNDDRWEKATDPWNQTGRTIEEYRSLIINHETGHRLGFRDNNITCSQPNELAPVMMQQSIALNGCAFNPWPLQSELDAL